MSIIGSNILAGASGQGGGGYTIERSVRLRSSASAYFSRTLTTPTNNKVWTWSAWVKKGTLTSDMYLASANGTTAPEVIKLSNSSADNFEYAYWNGSTYAYQIRSTLVLRDPSAWYHIAMQVDTTQATASNRVRIYVNNVEITSFSISAYPAQNTNTRINSAIATRIGAGFSGTYFDGYLTEVNFIDGQALTPSDFGEYNADTGVWQPAKYTGTYGTNGFYLDFSDNTTTTTLAEDKSGNGNDWTANNISLTSGSTYDSMTDTPTIYAGGGNYAVMNPLTSLSGRTSFSAGNLQVLGTSSIESGVDYGTIGVTSGKWYWENTVLAISSASSYPNFGAIRVLYSPSNGKYVGDSFAGGAGIFTSGTVYKEGSLVTTVLTYTTNDVIGIALDVDNLTCAFYKNGLLLTTVTGLTAGTYWAGVASYYNSSAAINFGQRPFAYTPPSGFLSLHTGNLPEPEIVDGSQYFDATLYTGNAVQDRAVTGFDFDLGLGWIKARSNAGSHVLVNSVSGGDKQLFSNLTNAEQTNIDVTNGFTTGGLILGDNVSGTGSTNQSGYTYTLWGWKAGGAGASNTDGSITSTVSANPTAGFSIVTYTGTGANATVGHGLGVAPKMVIVKKRNSDIGSNWVVWHTNLLGTEYILLESTGAKLTNAIVWNSTIPASTVFNVGTATGVNNSGATYVAYCFSEVEGYSKFGSYTGNGSDDGTFVFTGFRPAFVMIKQTTSTGNWTVIDTTRSPYNIPDDNLQANTSLAEFTNTRFDILSNGIKMRRGASGDTNTSGGTYIYMAFAENPFKNSLAR